MSPVAAVEVGGEGVPQGVRAELFVDPSLPGASDRAAWTPGAPTGASVAVGEKQRPAFAVALAAALLQVGAQKGAQGGLEELHLRDAALGADPEMLGVEVHIIDVQVDQFPQPDARCPGTAR